ncbi:MAG TPA: endonuclease III [Phycisphaerae bacterium]|nr:endonuclease III [Phycisphaerae bacterium]
MSPDRRATKRVLKLLTRRYGRRTWQPGGHPVDVLVATILSQNTSAANSSAGFRKLRRRFRSWSAAADAPVRRIEECIRVSGLSRVKAPRIRSILRAIRRDRGRISLAFLRRLPPTDAVEYLMRFDGIGPKTAGCVLLFAFAAPVFPVDTHIVRIARRLAWVAPRTTAEQTQQILTPAIAPADRYAMHVLLIAHGRKTCRARSPRCEGCDLLDLCPDGRTRASLPAPRPARPCVR